MRKKEKIAGKIRKCLLKYKDNIPFAFLFGSAAQENQIILSDIDLGIFLQHASENRKAEIEQKVTLLFDEQVHIVRLEDDDISADLRLSAVGGVPILINDKDSLYTFILSLIHRAEEERRILRRLKAA